MADLWENQTDAKKEKLSGGEWLMSRFGVVGCVFLLLLAAAGVLICFTAGTDPIPGYAPPLSAAEYAADPAALAAELEEQVLPHLPGVVACAVEQGRVTVTLRHDDFAVTRGAILQYFPAELLRFVDEDGIFTEA